MEAYGPTWFVVLKPARDVDSEELVTLSEFMLFLGEGFLVTVRHGETPVIDDVRRQFDADPRPLDGGPPGVLHAVMDRVVDDYGVVLRGLDVDVDDIERQVFSQERKNHGERIYKLKSEVLEFRQAVMPLLPRWTTAARASWSRPIRSC